MAQAVKPVEDDPLPPAVAPRSRKVSPQFAKEAEGARQRRAEIAANTIGDPQDEGSERLAHRRAHKARLAPQPLYSRPRAARPLAPDDLDGTADNTMASAGVEFDALEDPTADQELESEDANT